MKKIVNTDKAPKAIGTYSQAVLVNGFLYVSGQIGMLPDSGELISEDFIEQADQAFKNIKAILNSANMTFTDIVKMNVSILDMAEFQKLNSVMAEFVSEPYPARAAVAVQQLPKNAKVEIEVIAAK